MKLYNPFKWHVWQSPDTGYWYIRKFKFLFGWVYLDCTTNKSWTIPDLVKRYCKHLCKEDCENALSIFLYQEAKRNII